MTVDFYLHCLQNQLNHLLSQDTVQHLVTSATAFVMIVAAEMGDKSQLVCMTLASRHRAFPVLLGASAAFAFLNTLAVVFGAAIANWLPDYIIAAAVCVLFSVFALHALFSSIDTIEDEVKDKKSHQLFFTTFVMITVAEFGDKTQLAVVAFSSASNPYAVWFGSTAALILTSAVGVLAGRTLLKKISLSLVHKISGIIFLCLALYAGMNAYEFLMSDSILTHD